MAADFQGLFDAWGGMTAEASAPQVMAALANPASGVTVAGLEAALFERLHDLAQLPEAREWAGILAEHLAAYNPKLFAASLVFKMLRKMLEQKQRGKSVADIAAFARIAVGNLIKSLVLGLDLDMQTTLLER